MVIRHGADLMVVGANSITADRFMKYLREVASEILQGEGIEPWVAFGPTDVSQVYATSDKAKYNLKGFSSFTKQAISLARFKQSPIAETLGLWSNSVEDNLVLSMSLHPFQRNVSEGALHAHLYNIAVSSVNEIGLDLHLTIRNENHHHLYQFISGLGF